MEVWVHDQIKLEVTKLMEEITFFRKLQYEGKPHPDQIWPRGGYPEYRHEKTFTDLQEQINRNQKKLGKYVEQGLIAFL
jgi:cobyrinic acid a,c-diamide synthase